MPRIFDIEAMGEERFPREKEVSVTSLAAARLQVFNFVPEEPSRPWSLDDVEDPKIIKGVGEWAENVMDGLSNSYAQGGEDDRGRALMLSLGGGTLIAVGAILIQEATK